MAIEHKILDFLHDAGYAAYIQRPAKLPTGAWIIAERTGTQRENQLEKYTIAVQCYHDTPAKALDLAENVKTMMIESLLEHDDVSSVKLDGMYEFNDPSVKQYRYQMVFDILYYAD